MEIVIIDYGMGNLGSIVNMFKKVGASSKISGDESVIANADKLLLPGVGSFDKAMQQINDSGLKPLLDYHALVKKKPILGICLGMQLLTNYSEEGKLPGLAWIAAKTVRFPKSKELKVPHMGWNVVIPSSKSLLTHELPDESRFYFVHSYHVIVEKEENSILKCNYGLTFDAAIQKDNIYGAQFHPEKSHKYGMKLFKNFASL